jgi:hypothetical protein
MKYHIMAFDKATPRNWQRYILAFAARPHRLVEPFVLAIQQGAGRAQIRHNRNDELLAFLNSAWRREFCTMMNPIFETSEPHEFRLIRRQWGVTVILSYNDFTGQGLSSEGIHLTIKGTDPEAVRQFGYLASKSVGQVAWIGSLHLGGQFNQSITPAPGVLMSVDHAVEGLIRLAAERQQPAATATV